jgi:hypothetical protein
MWETALLILKAVGPVIAVPIIRAIFGGDGKKSQEQALSTQTDIANQQLLMQRQQFGQDLPFRTDLFGALRGRQTQAFPQVLPKEPGYQNPMSNRTMMTTLPGEGPATGASRGGFNAMPDLSDSLRQQRQPQGDIQQLLTRLLERQAQGTR